MKKVLAILFLCILMSGLAVAGCASRDRTAAPTQSPTTTAAPVASSGPSNVTATLAPNTSTTSLDPSLADISGEDDDSLPELDIPTPGAE